MNRKLLVIISSILLTCGTLWAKEQLPFQPYELDKLIRSIDKPTAPVVTDDYIIFTADTRYHYVGIAFDFENYQIVHPFQILMEQDMDGKKTPKHLFYTYKRTHRISEIKYRLVIEGIWTTDPLNPDKEYDEDVNLYFSIVSDPESIIRNTELTSKGTVQFIYKGTKGQKVYLGGTFTSWDPWIYQMKETTPGFYELELPLPPGKYYYNYFIGLTPVVDNTNSQKAYSSDGRPVSVIEVK